MKKKTKQLRNKMDGAAVAHLDGKGATRFDAGKPEFSQMSHEGLRRYALTCREGRIKYGRGNWKKGLLASNLIDHAIEHVLLLGEGDTSEDHIGHAIWNLSKLAHFIKHRPELIDIPALLGLPDGSAFEEEKTV